MARQANTDSHPLTRRRRALYWLALAQLPFTTLLGLLVVSRGTLLLPGQSVLASLAVLVAFFLGCCLAVLPGWLLLRMGKRPTWWKGALIPASVILLMMLGVDDYNRRNATGVEVDPLTILGVSALMLIVLGVPGALIGARMRAAHRKAQAGVQKVVAAH